MTTKINKPLFNQMVEAGFSQSEIASMLNMSRQYLHRIRKANGWGILERRSDKGTRRKSDEEINANYNKRMAAYRKDNPEKFGYKNIRINGKCVSEHRYVIEQHLGHELTANEEVHHKDFDITNNALDNLQILTIPEHRKLHRERLL